MLPPLGEIWINLYMKFDKRVQFLERVIESSDYTPFKLPGNLHEKYDKKIISSNWHVQFNVHSPFRQAWRSSTFCKGILRLHSTSNSKQSYKFILKGERSVDRCLPVLCLRPAIMLWEIWIIILGTTCVIKVRTDYPRCQSFTNYQSIHQCYWCSHCCHDSLPPCQNYS